jgi:hypothetical protein
MKKLILFFTIALISLNLNAQGKGAFAVDKVAHLGVGYISSSVVTSALRAKGMPIHYSVGLGWLTATALGIGKEIYDKKHGGVFDDEDLLSTSFGGLCGSLTVAICFGDVEIKPFKRYRTKL